MSETRDIRKIINVNPKTGQIESDPQDSFWSTPKQYPEYHSVAVFDNVLWLIVSNALERSEKMPKVVSFLSIAEDISLIKSIKTYAVEWSLRKSIRIVSIIKYYANLRN